MNYAPAGTLVTVAGYTSGLVTLVGHLRAGWPIELLYMAIITLLTGLGMMIYGGEVHRPTIVRYTCNYCGRYGRDDGDICPHCLHGWIIADRGRE